MRPAASRIAEAGPPPVVLAQQRNIALFHLFRRARRGPAHRTAVDHVPGRPPPHEKGDVRRGAGSLLNRAMFRLRGCAACGTGIGAGYAAGGVVHALSTVPLPVDPRVLRARDGEPLRQPPPSATSRPNKHRPFQIHATRRIRHDQEAPNEMGDVSFGVDTADHDGRARCSVRSRSRPPSHEKGDVPSVSSAIGNCPLRHEAPPANLKLIPRRIDGTAVGGAIHALSMAPVPDAEEARWAKGG